MKRKRKIKDQFKKVLTDKHTFQEKETKIREKGIIKEIA